MCLKIESTTKYVFDKRDMLFVDVNLVSRIVHNNKTQRQTTI